MAVFAIFPSGADVGRYAWPEHSGFCTGGHHRYALVGSVEGISPRSEGGMITLSLYRITPSVDVMFSRYW